MVQLPATAAIVNVAACWVFGAGEFLSGGAFVRGVFCLGGLFPRGSFARGDFWPGGGSFVQGGDFCPGGLCPPPPEFNAYTHRLGFLCLAS